MKQQLTDTSSAYLERRHQSGSMSGLTHATGVNLVARERWNFGANAEFGNLVNQLTASETDRQAMGVRVGYGASRSSSRAASSTGKTTRSSPT